jgi:hypothetical protein
MAHDPTIGDAGGRVGGLPVAEDEEDDQQGEDDRRRDGLLPRQEPHRV